MATQPRIAITMGDPAGIGPELCLRLADSGIIYGDLSVMNRVADQIGIQRLESRDVKQIGALKDATPGQVSAACGLASFQYVEAAIQDALAATPAPITPADLAKQFLRGSAAQGSSPARAKRCRTARR